MPKEGAHAKKVDYGRSKHYRQAALWNRNDLLHGSLQLYETVYCLLLTIIKYNYFIMSNLLTF